jgi:hypothetical protein
VPDEVPTLVLLYPQVILIFVPLTRFIYKRLIGRFINA